MPQPCLFFDNSDKINPREPQRLAGYGSPYILSRDCPCFRGRHGEAVVDENGTAPLVAAAALLRLHLAPIQRLPVIA